MNLKPIVRLNGKSGFVFALALAAALPAALASEARTPSTEAKPNAAAPNLTAEAAPTLTRAEAQEQVSAARQYVAHPPRTGDGNRPEPQVTMPNFDIATAPPTPRVETKPAAPAPGLVWVAGHYMPIKGEWRWVRGEWAVPATPSSVWIAARYDEKEQKWSPGYWQPDAPTPALEESPTKSGTPLTPPASATNPAIPAPGRY